MDVQDWTEASYDEARLTLKKWREEHARRSEEVVEIWEHVLSRYVSMLRDELWVILEQVVIAALDSARHDLAIECLQRLDRKFPHSTRVTKLQAMRLESLGNYDDASYLYEKLIENDETNMVFRKRNIAICIARGDRLEAIQQLNQYLETFVNDSEAWLQLSELFLQESDYAKAAFCFEELLLANPQNVTFLCRIADIRYTMGGPDNTELARAYYEKSVKLVPTANALYGLILCCNQLLTKATSQRRKELVLCGIEAANQLIALYSQQDQPNQAENPTVERQIHVIRALKNQFKE